MATILNIVEYTLMPADKLAGLRHPLLSFGGPSKDAAHVNPVEAHFPVIAILHQCNGRVLMIHIELDCAIVYARC